MKTKENCCYITTKYSKYKMPFNLYQGRNGGIYLGIGSGTILLTKEQLLKVDLPFIEVNDYDHQLYLKFYNFIESDK
jgi:hypothetical protein